MLKACEETLLSRHDLAMFDLDGVVYVGGKAIPGVPERLERVRDSGVHLAFVTNNASRTPEKVAAKLEGVGVTAAAVDVVTSAQAAARVLVDEHGAGARVLLLVGEGRPYSAREIAAACGVPVVASLAWDPASAEVLAAGATPGRRFETSPLVRSIRAAISACSERITQRRDRLEPPIPAAPSIAARLLGREAASDA